MYLTRTAHPPSNNWLVHGTAPCGRARHSLARDSLASGYVSVARGVHPSPGLLSSFIPPTHQNLTDDSILRPYLLALSRFFLLLFFLLFRRFHLSYLLLLFLLFPWFFLVFTFISLLFWLYLFQLPFVCSPWRGRRGWSLSYLSFLVLLFIPEL